MLKALVRFSQVITFAVAQDFALKLFEDLLHPQSGDDAECATRSDEGTPHGGAYKRSQPPPSPTFQNNGIVAGSALAIRIRGRFRVRRSGSV